MNLGDSCTAVLLDAIEKGKCEPQVRLGWKDCSLPRKHWKGFVMLRYWLQEFLSLVSWSSQVCRGKCLHTSTAKAQDTWVPVYQCQSLLTIRMQPYGSQTHRVSTFLNFIHLIIYLKAQPFKKDAPRVGVRDCFPVLKQEAAICQWP